LLVGLALFASGTSVALAGTETWGGNTDTNWNTAGNWSTAVPVNGDDVTLNAPTGKNAPSNQNIAGLTLNSLTLNTATLTTTFNNGYAISGNAIGLESGGVLRDNAANLVADTISTGLTLNGPATIVVASGSGGLIIDGTTNPITGTGPLNTQNNAGPGKLILLGANTYTGGTEVTAGTLQLGNGTSDGGIDDGVTVDSGAALVFDEHNQFTMGSIDGAGGLQQSGAGLLILDGNNTYTGGTTIDSGKTLQLGSTLTPGSIVGNVADSGLLDFHNIGVSPVTFAGNITGGGSVQLDAGTLVLTGTNTWSGGTDIEGGTLQVGNNATAGSISATGNITDKGTLDFNNLVGGFQLISGNITGAGGVQVDGGTSPTGNLVVLTGTANSYTGGTVINAGGTLQVGTITTGGTIAGASAITDNGTLVFGQTTTPSFTVSGLISGSGKLVVGQAPSAPVTLILTNADTYSGGTTIAAGSTLQIGDNANAGSITGNVTDLGLLDFHNVGGTTTFTGAIQATGAVQVDNGADVILTSAQNGWSGNTTINSGGTLEIGNGGSTGVIGLHDITDNGSLVVNESGPLGLTNNIGGSGAFTQQGSGTTTLVGAATYSGLTTVNGGKLVLTNGVLAGDATIASGANLTFQDGVPGTVSYGGAITGLGSFSQLGTDTIVFTGSGNTYSGGTTIGSLSTLQIGDATHTGSLATNGDVTDNGKLSFVNFGGGTTTISGNITGSGKVDVNLTSGTVALTGTNSYSGGTIIEGGTLQVASSANIGGATGGQVSFANGATLQFTGADTYAQAASLGTGGGTFDTNGNTVTWRGVISGGANGMTKTGAGTLILTNTETYTGDTTVSGGTLQVGNGITNGSLAGNTVDNATVDFDESGNLVYGSVISGSGVVEQISAGTLTLSGTNTYSGGTNVNAGTLSIGSDANLGNGGTVALAAATTLKTTATGTYAHDVTLTGDPTFNVASGTTTTWSGLISDGASAGTLEVSGGGTFAPTNAGNSYSGGTVVHHGSTIVIDASGELGAATGSVTLGNATTHGTLDVAANMTLEPTRTVSVDAGGGTIQTESGVTFEIGQGIGGPGRLTVAGPGTFILAGTSTYSGGTTISGGNLQLGDGVSAGAIDGDVVDNGSLTFDEAGNATFSGIISGNGSVTQNDGTGGTLTLNNTSSYTGGTTITSGTLQLGDGISAGAIVGNVIDNSTLAFDEPTDTVLTTNVAGTGGVNQLGAGKIILTGANTYTGPTVINATTTLQIGNGGAGGSINPGSAVTDNGTLAFDESGTLVIGNAVGGSGGINQLGTGTTALTGASTYTGTTLISGGTLSIGNGGATGSIDPGSAVTDNGTLAFNETGSLLFANAVSGTGGLAQVGTGTTTLTANLTNTGPTLISAGTLQIGNGGTTGALGGGAITDNGTLAFDRSDTVTLGSAVSGSGGLSQIGSGMLILTGANSFTGTTTISAGSVQIGNGGTSGSLAGNVADGTNLAFDRSDTLTYGGVISGAGSVSQIGAGTTILTGANTYTGGTTISAGTLSIGNGGATGAIAGNVANAGTLEFDRAGTFAFGGVISGAGGVVQAGVGTTTLSTAQTYTGSTSVTSGTLVVNNSIATSSGLTVSGGGTIAGTGTLPKTTVANGGTIAPGSSGTGTLTVNGNLILGAGSTYSAVITPSSSDLVKVLGTATLNGGLTVTPTGTGFGTAPIPILTALGGVSGKFTTFSVIAPPSSVIPILTYDADDAFLSFIPSVISLLPSSSANTNQARVANAIDFALVHFGAFDFAQVASLSGAQLQQTLSEMSGEEGIAFQNSALLSMRGFLDRLLDPMVGGRPGLAFGTGMSQVSQAGAYEQLADNAPDSELPVENNSLRGVRLWADGFGFQNTTDADAKLGTHKTSATEMGGELGVNYTPEYGNGALGLAAGVNDNRWSLASQLGKGQATAYQVGAYYSRGFDNNYFSAAFSYAFYNASTLRTLNLGGINVYHAAFDAQSEAGSFEFGHVFDTDDNNGHLGPYLRLAADDLGIGKYSETTVSGNPNFGLSYVGKQHFDYTTELGGFYRTLLDQESDSATVLNTRLGWLHDFDHSLKNTATFTAFPGASFTVNGAPPPADSAHLMLGIEHDMNQFALSLSGEGAFSGSAKSYGGTASVSYRW
jgi:autotransporter-associated beta strand protein